MFTLLVRLQERFQVKNPPHTYIQKLRGYLDPGVTRKVGQYKWSIRYDVHLKEKSTDLHIKMCLEVLRAAVCICKKNKKQMV